jgi:hypothetical protein
MKNMVLLLVALLLVAACATAQPAPTSTLLPPTEPPPTPLPEPTNTSIPPTEIPPVFEVMFDGKDCTGTGPTELPAGEHTFIFIDRSDWKGELWLLNNNDGKTFQDHLDLQSAPGVWFPKPSWSHHDSRVSIESEELDGRRVDLSTWNLRKVGEHTIICYVSSPTLLWYVAPLMIVQTPSE